MVSVVLEVEVCEVGGARAVDVQLREWAADLLVGQELGLGSSPVDVTGQLLRRNTSDLNQKGSPITIKRGVCRNEKLPSHLKIVLTPISNFVWLSISECKCPENQGFVGTY